MSPRMHHNEDGASAVEYELVVFNIAAVIAASVFVFVFGTIVLDTFAGSCSAIEAEAQTGTAC